MSIESHHPTDRERSLLEQNLGTSIYGTAEQVAGRLGKLLHSTGADELLVTGGAYDIAGHEKSDAELMELV